MQIEEAKEIASELSLEGAERFCTFKLKTTMDDENTDLVMTTPSRELPSRLLGILHEAGCSVEYVSQQSVDAETGARRIKWRVTNERFD